MVIWMAQCVSGCPRSVRLIGRSPTKENSDICGEYIQAGEHLGRVVYVSHKTGMAIRWWQARERWVIDREGVRQSDVCVAYAAGADTVHPADPQLLWHVWDSLTMAHVPDVDIISTDAPASLSFLGRGLNRENNVVNGEYDLVGAYHGLPAYLHRNGRIAIRFNAHERRWLLSQVDDTGNMCSAFTEAGCSRHPGEASLDWHFWELERRAFVPDPLAKAVVAPGMLHIVGRLLQAENARINGTYYLAGVKDKRPLYVKPGTHGVIRYSAKHDWWLIDCDGLEKPSIMTRLFHWILSGDSSAATDRCSAFAEARGTADPCHVDLEWHVWETRRGSHISDPCVRATIAPTMVQVRGRDAGRENGDITGDYEIAGTHLGRPAYQKRGSRMAIRYWPPMQRWVIDREGMRTTDTCVAFADCPATEHPACDLVWHVYETARGCHLADLSVKIREAPTVPSSLPIVLTPPARSIAGRGSRDAAEAFVAGTYLVGGTERRGTKRLFDLLGA